MADELRIALVCAEALLGRGLRAAVDEADGLTLLAVAAAASDVARAAGRTEPDVILVARSDVRGGGGRALAADLDSVRRRWPGIPVVLVTAAASSELVTTAFGSGIGGIVTTAVDQDELVRAIRSVASGGRHLDPRLGAELARVAAASGPTDGLSAREREVLALLAMGHTNREIAESLVISLRTVEGHRARLMDKLRAGSRAELVRHALAGGLVDLDDEPTGRGDYSP